MSIPVEIERKYVIAIPPRELLESLEGYSESDIDQTYLTAPEGVTRRVRARRFADRTVYTETKKVRIDKLSSFEDERELEREEYESLLSEIKTGTVTIKKTRVTFKHRERIFEVDIYPNWLRSCILEVELPSRNEVVELPDFIQLIAEVTGDKRYSNAAMSREFPKELV